MRRESDEQVLFRGHPSWRAMLAFHVNGVILAVIAGVVAGLATRAAAGHVQPGWVAVAVVAVFAVGLAAGALRRAATTYTVTDRRLIVEHGILGRDMRQTRLAQVQNVASHQTLGQRLLHVGSVHFDTAAGADYEFVFEGVSGPRELVHVVDQALGNARLGSWV